MKAQKARQSLSCEKISFLPSTIWLKMRHLPLLSTWLMEQMTFPKVRVHRLNLLVHRLNMIQEWASHIVHNVAVGVYTYTCNSIHWCKPGHAWLIFIHTWVLRKYHVLLIMCTDINFRVQECHGYLPAVLLDTGCEDITGPHTDNYNCWGMSHFICRNTHVCVGVQHDCIYTYWWGFLWSLASVVTISSSSMYICHFPWENQPFL